MTLKEKAVCAVQALKAEYPLAQCSLDADSAFRLLVAVRLSAQCTDARVNLVTPTLFEHFPDAVSMAAADVEDVEKIVRPCGFFHTKAREIVAMSNMLLDEFGGVVPDTIEQLTRLPGVGRKTANLICGDVYGKPAVVADTHLIRISNLLGLVSTKNPEKVETVLLALLPPDDSNGFCHRCVMHGRKVCIARRPQCKKCCLRDICDNFVPQDY